MCFRLRPKIPCSTQPVNTTWRSGLGRSFDRNRLVILSKLVRESYHSLPSRFLDSKVVTRQRLQLVGVVAMLIGMPCPANFARVSLHVSYGTHFSFYSAVLLSGAKYEEIYPPEIKDFIYISANTYTKDEILRMELLMLNTLEFNLTVPTMYPFVQRGLQVRCAAV